MTDMQYSNKTVTFSTLGIALGRSEVRRMREMKHGGYGMDEEIPGTRDHRPQGTAELRAIFSNGWNRITRLAVEAAQAGNIVTLNAIYRGPQKFHVVNIRKGECNG